MKLSKVLSVKKRIRRQRMNHIVFLASGILSLVFILITFYGQNAGNFIMTVDYDAYKRGIVLSKDDSFNNPQSKLMTRAIDDAIDMNYAWLKLDQVQLATGNYIDPDFDYIAYTFHIKNNGSETVDIGYHIRITDVYKNMDAAIRVLVIEDGVETVYKKPESPTGGTPVAETPNTIKPVHFLTDTIVTRKRFTQFKPGDTRKFSIVIWIEGTDPDTVDDILGGMVKLQMIFAIDTGA
jgi:hypothetical protein